MIDIHLRIGHHANADLGVLDVDVLEAAPLAAKRQTTPALPFDKVGEDDRRLGGADRLEETFDVELHGAKLARADVVAFDLDARIDRDLGVFEDRGVLEDHDLALAPGLVVRDLGALDVLAAILARLVEVRAHALNVGALASQVEAILPLASVVVRREGEEVATIFLDLEHLRRRAQVRLAGIISADQLLAGLLRALIEAIDLINHVELGALFDARGVLASGGLEVDRDLCALARFDHVAVGAKTRIEATLDGRIWRDVVEQLRALCQVALAIILAKRADFEIEEVLKKVRDGRTYFDVEGEIADGSELEFDILMTHNGPEIVEIQRDLVFSALADEVQVAAQKAMGDRKIIRIIESIQSDGAVIYELFEEGKPTDPAEEIRVSEGKIERLKERWAH